MKKSITTALAALLLIVFVALACNEGGDAPGNEPAAEADKASSERTATESEADKAPEEEQSAEEPEEETPEPTPAGPERIRFKRGMSEGTITVPLSANERRRYVVGVTWGQNFHIEIEDFRPTIRVLTTSKLTDISEGDSYFEGLTTKDGDIVFEIANPTRNSISTTATISIYDKVY